MGLYRSPTGAIEEIPDDSAGAAVAGGYTPVTGAQAGVPVESAATGGALGTLGAGASSVLSGATLGLSDMALSGILNRGDLARLRADREANPIVSGAGQVVGAVLPAFADPASLASLSPAGLLSRGVSPLIERGGAAALLGGGIEGAAQNAGAYLADTALGDRDLSAEGIASALGSGFAFGAGGGAVAMGLEKGTIAARRMFSRLVDGTDDAAMRASQAWQTQYQATLEAHDAALDIAKAELAKARAARESAALGRDRASAGLAEVQALAPEIDKAHAVATGLDEKIAAIEAQEAPKFVGSFEDLNRLVTAHEANRTELEDVLRSIEAPDLGSAAAPVVPVGEFGVPGVGGIKSADDLARAASEASAPTEPAAATRALRGGDAIKAEQQALYDFQGGRALDIQDYARSGKLSEGSVFRDDSEIKDTIANIDSAIKRERIPKDITLYRGIGSGSEGESRGISGKLEPGSIIHDPGYSPTSTNRNVAVDSYTLRPGSTMLEISAPKGTAAAKIPDNGMNEDELLLGRGSKFKVKSIVNKEINGRTIRVVKVDLVTNEEELTLTGLLRGTNEKLASGESLQSIGAPSRANYVAEKSAKAQAFRERNAPMAKAEAQANREIAERRAAQLEVAKDAAIERSAVATNDIERATAMTEAKTIDAQITAVGRMPNAVNDVAKVAKVITAYEKSGAELVDGMGELAPPLAREHAAAYRASEDTADRKMVDRSTRAIDDHVDPQPVGRDRRPSANPPAKPQISEAKQALLESDAAYKKARVIEGEAKIKAREASDAAKVARSNAPAPIPVSEPASTSKLGAILTTAGVAAEIGVPGLPNPHDIPVIGPLLSAYLKYRVLKAAVGRFTGRVAATGDARAASLAAKSKQKIAVAIDRTLGLAAEAAPKARGAIVATSAALGRRIFDDGEPNHPTGATPQAQAAVRVREILAAASRPELVQAQVRREMHGVVDPDLIAAAEKHLTAMFGHLASVVPKPPPDNYYAKRPWVPSQAATHELSQRLAVINDSTHAINGPMSPVAADTFRTAFPQLYAMAKDRLIARVGDLSAPMSRDARLRASMLFQIPIDVSTDPSHVAVVRAPPKSEPKPAPMAKVPDVSSMYNPSNTRVK